jgi:hypothetical protein
MTLSDAYKRVLRESDDSILKNIAKGTLCKELAEKLKTIAYMLENRMSTVEEQGVDKVGDFVIEIGNKIKSL